MPLPQTKFREAVFQLLYGLVVGQAESDSLVDLISKELGLKRVDMRRVERRVTQVLAARPELDSLIAATSREYALDRIQSVEQNILRLGIFELRMDPDIPPKVAISEAIRLAKKFSTPESATFVNALMDQVYDKSATLRECATAESTV